MVTIISLKTVSSTPNLFCHALQESDSKFANMPTHMGLGRHIISNDSRSSPSLDSMGTYTAEDPPQDEPGQ